MAVLVALGCSDPDRRYGQGSGGGSGEGGTANSGAAGGTDGAGAKGGTDGNGAQGGSGGSSGSDSDGGEAGAPPLPDPGEPCTDEGALRCAGTNQRARLECTDGFWVDASECKENERCDTRAESAAECQPVLEVCADKEPGEGVCVGLERSDCGADLVTLEDTETCDLFCVEHEGKSECSACEAEQYSSNGTPEGCTPWSTCDEGQYVLEEPSAIANRVCAPCVDAYSTAENAAACTPWTTCVAGKFVVDDGTTTTDRTCDDCDSGYTSDDNVATCSPWTVCTWASGGLVQAGTPSTNAECGVATVYRQFGTTASDSGLAVATDSSGNVYVAGHTQGDLAGTATIHSAYLRKYNPTGNIVWTKQFGTGGGPTGTLALAVTVDSNGNPYLAGTTALTLDGTSAGGADAWIRKYTPNGDVTWARQFGTTNTDWANAVAVDASGNVYVAGETNNALTGTNAGSYDAFLRKFDSAGNTGWTKQWGTSTADRANAVAVVGNGNVYVVSSMGGDAELRTYAPNGDDGWVKQFGSADNERAYGLGLASNGDAYVSGETSGAVTGTNAGGTDVFLRKYAANGGTVWTKQFGTAASESSWGAGVDGSGNVYVVGSTSGAITGTNAGQSDAFVRKYDSAGGVVWTQQFGTSGLDDAQEAAADPNGNVYVVGNTAGALGLSNIGGDDVYVKQIAP